LDPTTANAGVIEKSAYIPANAIVLAFFSSCIDQPRRFQFIYVENGQYTKDENRIITNKNCQYYLTSVKLPPNFVLESLPPIHYGDKRNGFFLPQSISSLFDVVEVAETYDNGDVVKATISGLYRGARYGFSH
jgi:hypothetical protein